MKNTSNFLRQSLRLCTIIAVASLIFFSMAACSDGSSSSSGKATLIIENLSAVTGEIITNVYWSNSDTGVSKDEKDVGIPIYGKKYFSLDEGTYYVSIYTNMGGSDDIYDLHIYAGSTVSLLWTTYLSKR